MPPNETDRKTHTSDFIEYDIDNVVFYENPVLDNLMTTVIALGSEVWTTKRRVKILESVLAKQGVSKDLVESYVPTSEEETEWRSERDQFIEKTYGALKRGGDDAIAYGVDLEKSRGKGQSHD